MRRPSALLVLLAMVLALAGCTNGGSDDSGSGAADQPTERATPRFGRYVALGDSYSAGPLIPTTDVASGCLRSDHNYPSLLAKRLDVATFVDVTCSGATSADVTGVQQTFGGARIPAQIAKVTADTDLVTIGIGGNDLDLFTTVIGTCTRARASDPTGDPCTRALRAQGDSPRAKTAPIQRHVTRVLTAIKARAPKATVVLVGYLRLAPDRGTCRALPLARGDYAEGRRFAAGLQRALTGAAKQTGVLFADSYAASRGHDICSADPWVNGSVSDQQRAAAYHPFEAGMRADVRAILAALPPR